MQRTLAKTTQHRGDGAVRVLPADYPPPRTAEPDDIINLPEVARHVLDIVFADGDDVPSHRGLVWAGVRYGISRALLGQPRNVVDEELALLQLAAEQRINRLISDEQQRTRALALLERSVELARRAARLGCEREALRDEGRWDAELQRVLRASPFVSAA